MTIKQIKVIPCKVVKNKKGDIIKYINNKNKLFTQFGEIYFSEIKKNYTKGWNLHKKNNCLISVPFGKVVFTIFNPQKKKLTKIILGKKNNKIILIPSGNWFMFNSLTKISIVSNLMDKLHSKKETLKNNIINNIKIK